MNRIDELRDQYYEAIRLLQNKEDILEALPKPEYGNFFPHIDGLIILLEKELDRTNKALEKASKEDISIKEHIEEEINVINFK